MDIKQAHYPELPQPAPSPAPQGVFANVDALRSLRVHALAATLVTLLTLGLGLALLLQHPATYAASSIVYVSPNFPATLSADQEHQYSSYDSYIAEQVHSVTRYDVLADALRQMKPGIWRKPEESEASAIERLQKQLVVERDGLSYQMNVTLTGIRPDNLAEIVNTVTNSYLKKMKGEEFYGQDERLSSLKNARESVQKELNTDLAEQAKISSNLGVAVIGGQESDQLDVQTAKLRTDLIEAHEQRIQAEAQLSSLENGNSSTASPALDAAADDLIANDASLTSLKASLSQKRALLLEQLGGLTPNNPLRKTTEAELARTEAGLQQLQDSLRSKAAAHLEQKLRTELNRTTTVENQISRELATDTNKATTAAPQFQRADELKAQITALQARYATLDERERNLELEGGSPAAEHVFSPARTPITPVKSRLRKFGPLLLPLALFMGIGSVVLIDLLDPRIYSPADIEQVLGFAPMGAIFDEREVTMRAFDECSLRLAAGIDQAARNAGVRTVVITAVHAGAGTTSIVENVGSTLAKLGRKTLTIDASGVSAPIAYLTIGYNRTAQKAEDGAPAASGSAPNRLQTASVVAQAITPQLTPLTSFMDQAFKDLTSEYDLVLIDATPLLISAETEYLARFADVTMLVVESGQTRKAQLRRSSRLLERLNVQGIAAVINKVSLLRASQAIRNDVAAFEAHVNRMNLRWRPGSKDTAVPGPGEFEGTEKPVDRENPTYA